VFVRGFWDQDLRKIFEAKQKGVKVFVQEKRPCGDDRMGGAINRPKLSKALWHNAPRKTPRSWINRGTDPRRGTENRGKLKQEPKFK